MTGEAEFIDNTGTDFSVAGDREGLDDDTVHSFPVLTFYVSDESWNGMSEVIAANRDPSSQKPPPRLGLLDLY